MTAWQRFRRTFATDVDRPPVLVEHTAVPVDVVDRARMIEEVKDLLNAERVKPVRDDEAMDALLARLSALMSPVGIRRPVPVIPGRPL